MPERGLPARLFILPGSSMILTQKYSQYNQNQPIRIPVETKRGIPEFGIPLCMGFHSGCILNDWKKHTSNKFSILFVQNKLAVFDRNDFKGVFEQAGMVVLRIIKETGGPGESFRFFDIIANLTFIRSDGL